MGLVELDPKKPDLNLRVFRRARDLLILFWDKIPQIQDKKPTITAKCLETRQTLQVNNFVLDPQGVLEDAQKNTERYICAIRESVNHMDDDLNYYLTVSYDDGMISQSKNILRSGVFPDTESEKRHRNVHMFLWDGKNQTWRKQEGILVETSIDGRKEKHFYPGFVQVPCPKCGYPNEEK